jgi:hypothetical protein
LLQFDFNQAGFPAGDCETLSQIEPEQLWPVERDKLSKILNLWLSDTHVFGPKIIFSPT